MVAKCKIGPQMATIVTQVFSIKLCTCTLMGEAFFFAVAIVTYNANKHPAVPAVGLGSLQEQIEKNITDQSCIVSLLKV